MTNQPVKSEPKKRVNIVSLQLVKESSVLYVENAIALKRCTSYFLPLLSIKIGSF